MVVIKSFKKEAQIFQALADEKRLFILDYLKRGETCACVLVDELEIAQSALSYHMKLLCQSGIVASRPEGKWKHYSLSESGRNSVLERLAVLTDTQTVVERKCSCYRKSS